MHLLITKHVLETLLLLLLFLLLSLLVTVCYLSVWSFF